VTQQASIFTGYVLRMSAWIRDTGGADLWVMDPQSDHTDDSKKIVDTALQRVRSIEGVAWGGADVQGVHGGPAPGRSRGAGPRRRA
jgi:hypothetical protein